MSLSFFLRSARRSIVSSLLPTIHSMGGLRPVAGHKFHSMCDNRTTVGPILAEASQLSLVGAIRGMKNKVALRLRCKDCYFVWRKGRKYVMCKSLGRHKQQAVVKKEEDTWILTHATHGKIRPW